MLHRNAPARPATAKPYLFLSILPVLAIGFVPPRPISPTSPTHRRVCHDTLRAYASMYPSGILAVYAVVLRAVGGVDPEYVNAPERVKKVLGVPPYGAPGVAR